MRSQGNLQYSSSIWHPVHDGDVPCQMLLTLGTVFAVWTLECGLFATFPLLVVDHWTAAKIDPIACASEQSLVIRSCWDGWSSSLGGNHASSWHREVTLSIVETVRFKPFTFEDAQQKIWIVVIVIGVLDCVVFAVVCQSDIMTWKGSREWERNGWLRNAAKQQACRSWLFFFN